MANFCKQCGSPVGGTGFCGKCGSPIGEQAQAPAPPAPAAKAASVPAKKGMSTGLKIGIAAVAIIFVGGAVAAAGMFYAANKVREKFHEATGRITGANADDKSSADNSDAAGGDPCRFLSKQEVGQAIGMEIVEAKADGSGCSYLAKGDRADMTAKHVAKMLGNKGADAKTQQMATQFATAIFKSAPQDKPDPSVPVGTTPVFNVSVEDSPAAVSEYNLNAKVMKNLGGGKSGDDLSSIGDEAFVSADGMIMARKGGKIIRIMYIMCPCGTEEVKPLAAKMAAQL